MVLLLRPSMARIRPAAGQAAHVLKCSAMAPTGFTSSAGKPLAIDLFCGLGGWTDGLLAEGWNVVGFDIERHDYGTGGYRAQLVLQDVLTLRGSQFRKASLIVASPPCQAFSYRAMPWKRAKALPPPSTELFDACFRIQREACEAAGRHIPMIIENVCGAQKWVGRAKSHYGSFYLWGDVPARMPQSVGARKLPPEVSKSIREGKSPARWTNPKEHYTGSRKQPVWFNDDKRKCGGDWFGPGKDCSLMRSMSSKSSAREAASAKIAKIPPALASHIAKIFKPCD
jgi:C-5 cytosine-specific DNA methylase